LPSPITQDLVVRDFCKTAGVMQALEDLGLLDGMEKEAFWGNIVRPALGALWKYTGGKAVGATAAPMSWAGQGVQKAVSSVSPTAGSFLGRVGRGAAREAAGFGLLSGGINAAMAEPGERGSAFARGFAGGALGGLGWRAGRNLTHQGLNQFLGSQRMGQLARAGHAGGGIFPSLRAGQYGQAASALGAKAVTRGLPFAGALGASMAMPTFETEQQQEQRPSYAPHMVYAGGKALTGGQY
jgi:hypothetical protein